MILKWHRRARQDLGKIRAYIGRDNPQAAARAAQRIVEAAGQLAKHPGIGRPGRVIDTRELIVTGTPYLMPYAVAGEEIVILRVLHGSQQWPAP
jgi:toxin ParE1/3/4